MNKFYVVKPLIGIISTLYYGLMFVLPILLVTNGYILFGVFISVIWAIAFFGNIYNCFCKKIKISMEGVEFITLFTNYKLKWEEIKTIGVSKIVFILPGPKPWIYFSKEAKHVTYVTGNMISNKFFMMNYQKNAIEEIKKYWKNDIYNLGSFEL